ncbi:MAG: glycosyltransferase family 39 protein [Gemmatimonadaceae bacterium]
MTHWRQALWIIAASTVVRLLLGAVVPLYDDEAYYWEWSRRLAAGYFDHPPMIAWLIAGGTALFGDSTFGVRVLPILCGSVTGLAIAGTARHLAGPSAARFAALVFAVLPVFAAGLVLATPDAPLVAALALALYGVVRALDAGDPAVATRHWALAGVAAGLAMASKFTGVLVPAGVGLALAAHPVLRRHLGSAGPWIAAALAAVMMIPVLRWNVQHDWIAFRFQLDHGFGVAARGSWWMRELELLGGQLGLVTPILLVLILAALARGLRAPREPLRFTLAVVAALCLAVLAFSATRRPVEPNWPVIVWIPGIALLASLRPALRTRWEHRGVWLAGGLSAMVLLHALRPFVPIAAGRDPTLRAHGWPAVTWTVERTRRWVPADSGPVVVVANRYQDAAMLAWHLSDRPTVYSLNVNGRRNQYDLWPPLADAVASGATLLLLLNDTTIVAQKEIAVLAPHFAAATAGPVLQLKRGDAIIGARRLWYLAGWSGTLPARDVPTPPRVR